MSMTGATLFVVATPLGNLGDLSSRAAELLRRVPVVAAEDTRRVRGLLAHLGASPRVLSYHAHSPARRAGLILEILAEGRDVALVTDAGTPGVSDPGEDLVTQARAAGFGVVPIPGPSAVTAALSVSGFPAGRYLFLGFAPRRGRDRESWLRQAASAPWTVVLFEAPGRVAALLRDLAQAAGGGRRVVVTRELTKLHEEIRAGTLGELAEQLEAVEPRGEFTIVLAGAGSEAVEAPARPDPAARASELLEQGLSRKDAAHQLARELGLPRNAAYRVVMDLP
jgi:16S rRNA (cytidine1402-2'-O)-methyltransferase